MKEIPKKSKNKDLPNPPPALPEVKPILPLPVRKFFRDLLLADICLFLVFFAVTFIVYRLFDLSLPSEFESFFYGVSLWVAIISIFLYIPWKPRVVKIVPYTSITNPDSYFDPLSPNYYRRHHRL